MKAKWRGKEFKEALWKCATSTTVPQFNSAMEELKSLNNAAYEWVKAIPAKHWSRSHFSSRPHCDVLLNNMCEALNSKLVKGRDKPIITCLEFIREYIMRKLVTVQKTIDKSSGPLTPTATKTLEKIKAAAAECRVIFCGNGKYQVSGEGMDQCAVNMNQQSCSCNRWELTGMPCKHAIAAIWDMRLNSQQVGIPETWVHPTYWLKTWKEMYQFKLEPINGRSMWEKSACPSKLVAPKHHVPIGRPKKKRRRSAFEGDGGRSVTCSKCGHFGHNDRSCKGQSEGPSNTTGGGPSGGTNGGPNGGPDGAPSGTPSGTPSATPSGAPSGGGRGGGRSAGGGGRGGGRSAGGGGRSGVGGRGGGVGRGGGRSVGGVGRGGGRSGVGGRGGGTSTVGSRGGGTSGVSAKRGRGSGSKRGRASVSRGGGTSGVGGLS